MFTRHYGRSLVHILLILMMFLFLVRPLMKTVKEIKTADNQPVLASAEEDKFLPEPESRQALPAPVKQNTRQKALDLAGQDVEKAANLIKGWLKETT
jgi:flagellar M-ring protein FliF